MALTLGDKFPLPCNYTPSGAFGGQIDTTNLVGYWKLDEASGDALDSHVNGYTITQNGTVGSAAGKITNCRGDYSAANFFSRADQAAFRIASNSATIWCWAKWTSLPSLGIMLSKSSHSAAPGNTREWRIFYYSNSVRLDITTDGTTYTTTAQVSLTPTLDTWYFLCGRFDAAAGKVDFRVNTTDAVQQSMAAPVFGGGAPFRIGNYNDTDYPHTGKVDEVGLMIGTRLSDADVAKLYNSGSGLTY